MSNSVSVAHANQLGRTLGALRAFQQCLRGGRYTIVGSARRLLSEHADRIEHDVEVETVTRVEEAELRTIEQFCKESLRHFDDGDDQQRLVAAAGFAAERLEEVQKNGH